MTPAIPSRSFQSKSRARVGVRVGVLVISFIALGFVAFCVTHTKTGELPEESFPVKRIGELKSRACY